MQKFDLYCENLSQFSIYYDKIVKVSGYLCENWYTLRIGVSYTLIVVRIVCYYRTAQRVTFIILKLDK